jgi:tryptophan-rich sensory protein
MDITFLVWAALIATVAFSGVALWETQNIMREVKKLIDKMEADNGIGR